MNFGNLFVRDGYLYAVWGVRTRVPSGWPWAEHQAPFHPLVWPTKQCSASGASVLSVVVVSVGRNAPAEHWRETARLCGVSFALSYLFAKSRWGHVSPSQIHNWRGCKRKWAYSRVRPRHENRYAKYGTTVHSYREEWLVHSVPPDTSTPEGRCAVEGLELLPMPGTALVEAPLVLEHEGVRYVGHIDVLGWLQGVHVEDHKTCGSFDHALTAETLFDDPQRIIYSHWAALAFQAPYVKATWHYLRRKPPKCQPVSMGEATPAIAARFAELHRVDGLPIAQSAGIPLDHFPRSLDHCHVYGGRGKYGCPYAEECLADVTPIQRAAAALARHQEKTMTEVTAPTPPMPPNLGALLQANAGGPPAAAPPVAAPPAAAPPAVTNEQIAQLIANPQGGIDVATLRTTYPEAAQIADAQLAAAAAAQSAATAPATAATPGAKVDTRTPEQKAPRKRRTTKAKPGGTITPADIILACAHGGLTAEEASHYLALAESLSTPQAA